MEYSEKTLFNIYNYHCEQQDDFLQRYSDWLLGVCAGFEDTHICEVRKGLIKVFNNDILKFKSIFVSHKSDSFPKNMPIITKEELSLINDVDLAIQLIDKTQISDNSIVYIAAVITANLLSDTSYVVAKSIIDSSFSLVSKDLLRSFIFLFLFQNRKVDDALFSFAVDDETNEVITKDDISQYINFLPIDNLSEIYLDIIDKKAIETGLSEPVLNKLDNDKKYITVLASYCFDNCLYKMKFSDDTIIASVKSACKALNQHDEKLIPKIRREIIGQNQQAIKNVQLFQELFYDGYPIITLEELNSFERFADSLYYINASKIDNTNYSMFVRYFNATPRTDIECYILLETLFTTSTARIAVTDSTVVRSIIEEIDYQNVPFRDMTLAQRETIVTFLSAPLNLSVPTSAQAFMQRTGCLIESLEKLLLDNGLLADYVELINKIQPPTDFTLQWIRDIDVSFRLPDEITTLLLKEGLFSKYLIAKTLHDGSFVFPFEGVDSSIIVEQYSPSSSIFTYLATNIDFVSYIIETREYEKFNPSNSLPLLQPLYKGKQTFDFMEFLFRQIDVNEKKEYLKSMGEIKDAANSKQVSYFLVDDTNIDLLEDDELFAYVLERLWEDVPFSWKGYKPIFISKRNEHFAKVRH